MMTALRLWFSSIPRTVFVGFAAAVLAIAVVGYIYNAGRKSEANENAATTLERAVETAKPITDDERAGVMRKYDRNRRELP